MIRALWTAATGMQAQQTNIDVIANNLANVNTTGFKKSQANFQDLLYQTMRAPGTATSSAGTMVPTGIQLGHGTRVASVSKSFSQGDYQRTDNQLDIVIEGKGFFQIQMPDGTTAYTRDGSFKMDNTGRVVTTDGYPLLPSVTVPANATQITISSGGNVDITVPGSTTPTTQGPIQLAQFVNPGGLSSVGRNLFTETPASGTPNTGSPGQDGLGNINQGYLEMSNVSMVEEMIAMISSQRAYEINSKTIQTSDEMLGQVASLKR